MELNSIICPYCKQEVENQHLDKICPHCGNYVKSQDWIDKQVDSLIRFMKRKGLFEYVAAAIYNGENESAIGEIRQFSNREDQVVEQAFVKRVLETKPENYVRSDDLISDRPVRDAEQKVATTSNLIPCPDCNRMISKQAEKCPGCGRLTGVHVCPNCGSINTRTISELSKATSVFLWGIFAANKVKSTYECKDCGLKF